MCLPKGVQLQPKIYTNRDALAIAVESIMANPNSHCPPDVQLVATSPMNQVVATLRTQQMPNRRPQMSPIVRQPVTVRPTVATIRQPVSAVRQPLRQSPSFVLTGIRQTHVTSTPKRYTAAATVQSPSSMSTFSRHVEPTDLSKIFLSPSKLSAPLTVSEPKPTIPSTVPDDFLEDSSETTLSDVGTSETVVSGIEPATSPLNAILINDDQSTRKSGRERKINRYRHDLNTGHHYVR